MLAIEADKEKMTMEQAIAKVKNSLAGLSKLKNKIFDMQRSGLPTQESRKFFEQHIDGQDCNGLQTLIGTVRPDTNTDRQNRMAETQKFENSSIRDRPCTHPRLAALHGRIAMLVIMRMRMRMIDQLCLFFV